MATHMQFPATTQTGESSREQRSLEVNVQTVAAALFRNRWPVLAILAASALLGIASLFVMRPVYRATASVQIDQQIAKVLGTEQTEAMPIDSDADRFLETQQDVLKSRDMAEQVVSQLKIERDPALIAALGLDPGDEQFRTRGVLKEALVKKLQESLYVSIPRLSRVAQIGIDCREASAAARIANAYVDTYIRGNLQRRFDQSAYSRKFLQDQLEQTRVKLEESERALVSFARGAGLIEIGSMSQGGIHLGSNQSFSLVTADLVQLSDAHSRAQAARIAAEQQWHQARATPPMVIPEVIANQTVQALSRGLAEARVEMHELVEKMKYGHPTVQQKAATIAALEEQLRIQANNVRQSIQHRYQIASREEQSLAQALAKLKGATLAERDRSIQYNILKREVDTNRELYAGLLQRYKALSAEAGVTTNNVSLVDIAIPPKQPSTPRPLINLGLALLGGIAVAGAWVIVREQFSDTVRTPDDIEARTGLPLLGVTPMIPANSDPSSVLQNPKSQFCEAVHAIRTALMLSTEGGMPRSLAITSTRPAEGKSTLAFALALKLANAGNRTILVDADMRAPSVHRLAGVQNQTGLAQLLTKQATIDEAIVPSQVDGLSIVTSGGYPPDPTLLLNGRGLTELVHELHTRFEIVLIDCPPILGMADAIQVGAPVLGLADALQIGAQVDAVLVVVEAKGTRFANLKAIIKRLRRSRANILGTVLSKFDARNHGMWQYYSQYQSNYGSDRRD